ncbi:MAG: hypothetical protein H0W99_15400 [Acidobacteria bacterium]|nr:hypothetical protein [Acidobacteriota bacterium]
MDAIRVGVRGPQGKRAGNFIKTSHEKDCPYPSEIDYLEYPKQNRRSGIGGGVDVGPFNTDY